MKKHYPKAVFFLFVITCFYSFSYAQQISFPGAEGAGKFTSGGRGTAVSLTTVFEVTNLTDVNTAGSLRWACSLSTATYPYRTIVFKVSGTIHLNSKLSVPKNTTIAGQTAPGDGICVADYPVSMNGDNIIIRYVRFRMGDKNQLKTSPAGCGVPVAPFTDACRPIDGSGGDDALGDLGHKNIMIDHCTISWSTDEALTMYRGDSLTLQWNLISEPLNYSYHFETSDTDFENHGYGGIWGALHGSFHHNLIAHCRNRTPRFAGNSTYSPGQVESADFRNNVLYNWGINNIYGGDGGQYNLVNNYYKFGPNTSSGVKYRIVGVDSSVDFGYAKYFLSGNYVDGSSANTANNWTGAGMNTGNAADTVKSKVSTPFLSEYLPSSFETATAAYDTVLKSVGAILPKRDTLDERVINNVKLRTGKIIDVQGGYPHATPYAQTVNAWPTLSNGTPPADTDQDGMPNTWETDNGLNPNNAADRGVFAGNGYTNLENYLNSITGVAITPPASTPASATWPLLTDQMPSVVGDITASNQLVGPYLAGIVWGSSFGGVTGWQRVGSTSGLPVWYNANSYTEYKVTPAAGKTLTVTSVELSALGGGTGTAKMFLKYSLDGFANSAAVGTTTYNNLAYSGTDTTAAVSLINTGTMGLTLTGQQVATIPTSITVLPSQTLTVRVYVWITGSGLRYFPSQNVKINGSTSDASLPLSLLSFSAVTGSSDVTLFWKTTRETDMKGFEIERSIDGRSFTSVGSVAAAYNATGNYSFTDNSRQAGTVYYRLKMIDKDGTYRYSFVVSVKNSKATGLSIYPNPVVNTITLTHGKAGNNASVAVLNIEGKKMQNLQLTAGTTQTSFNVKTMESGVYLLQYSDDKRVETIKFIRQ
ncbi:MAG: T9SS type A sorting domain-containing protein [Bacteroidota bacterium]